MDSVIDVSGSKRQIQYGFTVETYDITELFFVIFIIETYVVTKLFFVKSLCWQVVGRNGFEVGNKK